MKPNAVFKRAYNRSLVRLERCAVGSELGSELEWAQALGVSRTTVRAVFGALAEAGLVAGAGRRKHVLRRPGAADLFPDGETRPVREIVEKRFMKWILDGDCRPGQQINGLDLARQFSVSTSAIRDYLSRFSQFGLLDKRPNGGWMFKGVTRDFAEELFEVRVMFELRSAQTFLRLPSDDPAWAELERIRQEHLVLFKDAQTRFAEFSELDERFHRLINDASRNRFIVSFYDIISLIFHYHYQWNKRDERERNTAAIGEHLAYIAALQMRDGTEVASALNAHMKTARSTLLNAIENFERAA
jgi:DNA-binding GntR family transcriptional regulator